jgi:LmbE family N-acetylglucosaminyl deacetylase
VLQALRELSRAATYRIARDATADTTRRSALVLAPHPDDETLGCGATILHKVAAGTRVTVAVISDGRAFHRSSYLSPEDTVAMRREELMEAGRRLGLAPDDLRWCGFVDGTLDAHEEELVAVVRDLIDEVRPEEVYVTGAFEPHPDHCALGRAARRAVRGAGGSIRLLEYPIWLWTMSPIGSGVGSGVIARATLPMLLCRRVTGVRAGDHLAAKRHAIEAHTSQLNRPAGVPDDEPWALLPPEVLRQAGHEVELFLPWRAR